MILTGVWQVFANYMIPTASSFVDAKASMQTLEEHGLRQNGYEEIVCSKHSPKQLNQRMHVARNICVISIRHACDWFHVTEIGVGIVQDDIRTIMMGGCVFQET